MSTVTNAFTWTANTTAARLYFGCANLFDGLFNIVTTAGVAGNIKFEYYNGSTWLDLLVYNGTTANGAATAYDFARKFYSTSIPSANFWWDIPSDWVKNSVNSSQNYYWIRIVPTVVYSTQPKFSTFIPIPFNKFSKTIYLPEQTNRNIKSAFFLNGSGSFVHLSPYFFVKTASFLYVLSKLKSSKPLKALIHLCSITFENPFKKVGYQDELGLFSKGINSVFESSGKYVR
jgi:hypothetical protein